MLFDTRRGLYYPKPLLGWLHLLWFEASLVIGTLLPAHAHGLVQHLLGHGGSRRGADEVRAELACSDMPERHVVTHDLLLLAVFVDDRVERDV
jgi:hypothetical protein